MASKSTWRSERGFVFRPPVVRTILLVFVLGFAPVAILGYFVFRVAAASTHEQILAQNQSAAQLTRHLIQTEFEHRVHTLSGLATDPGFVAAVLDEDEAGVRDRLGALVQSQPRIERAFVTRPDGLLWSDYPRAPESLGINFSHRDWFAGVSAEWTPYVSRVYRRNAEPRLLLVAVAAPVRSPGGDVAGIVVYQIQLEGLTNLIREVQIGSGGYALVLDHEGDVVAHPHLDLQKAEHSEYAQSAPVRGASEGTASLEYVDPVSGIAMLSTASTFSVGSNDWTVITQQPVHEAYAPVRFLGWQIMGAGVLVALGLAAGLSVLAFYDHRLRQANAQLDRLNRDLSEDNRERRRRYGLLLKNLPGMVYRCKNDENWTMEFVSDECEPLTGYPPASLIQNRDAAYIDLVHPADREAVWNHVQSEVADKEAFTMKYRITTRGGEEKWVWERGRSVVDETGEVVALEGFITDITEQKLLEGQLLQSQKMEAIGQLAGGVAHDFNNLLTVITGYAGMMLNDLPEASPLREELTEINSAGERAAALTRQLLAFSRKQILNPEVINLNEIVAGMDRMLRRLIGENIDLVTQLAPDLNAVRFDPGQIEQIIMNLAVNARDAMPGGGKLTLETANVELDDDYARSHEGAQAGPHVMIAISDTGTGMDAATRDRIFEPFFTTKGAGKGTGLGLSTVFGIVKQSGGNIWVYSEPGRGSTFKVYLPQTKDPVSRKKGMDEGPLRGHGERILVVEDEDGVRKLIRTILERNGYEVMDAEDGKTAIELLQQGNGDIQAMLTDLVLADMDGKELAERAGQTGPDLRIIYMSGYTDMAAMRHGVLAEEIPFVQKPISPRELLQKLRTLLDS